MKQLPFDQLAKDLNKSKQAIEARRASLFQSGRGCLCDETGLCAHHADIANRLSDALVAIELAIAIATVKE